MWFLKDKDSINLKYIRALDKARGEGNPDEIISCYYILLKMSHVSH